MVERRVDLWLPTYVWEAASRARGRRERRNRLTHVFFLICDHYEPRHKATRPEQAFERVRTWQREYPRFQERCRRAFGHAPLHSWFYPPHHGPEHLPALAQMAHDGGGEIELHYHHRDDTAESLTRDLKATIALYHRHGLLLESGAPPRTAFGFVHGDWTLDNACNGVRCGVNGELSILRQLGCWGDFTMPSGNAAQTRKINAIYYAVDDPARHKSHDWGLDARVGKVPPGFFLMQGPLGVNWGAPGYPRIENASITSENWGRPDRIRTWLDCQVHVKGRPDWLFVKLHTHGAVERDFDALFGEKGYRMHEALNETCNDGSRYQLHYITARQAYNLARAAESGAHGDPRPWLDHEIAAPATAWYALDAEHRVTACTASQLCIDEIASGEATRLSTRVGALREVREVREVRGALAGIRIDATERRIALSTGGAAELTLRFGAPTQPVVELPGATLRAVGPAGDTWQLNVGAAGTVTLRCDAPTLACAG
jgi:hypothetical protein